MNSHEDADAAAKSLMLRGVKSVALTMGGSGAFIADETEATHIRIIKVDAVDTTGGGDASTVTRIGTPHRAEVDERMASRKQTSESRGERKHEWRY